VLPANRVISVGQSVIQPVTVVRDLDVLTDGELSMRQHVTRLSQTCFFHLRRLRSLRRQLGRGVMARFVSALVLSRLDYCNAVLTGLPASTLAPLQRVLHAAARVVMDLRPRDHVSPAVRDLHWLPIKQRIEFKLCLLFHKTLVGHSPEYISDLLTSAADVSGRPALRTASRGPIGSSEIEHVSLLLERGINYHPTSDSCVRRRHSGAISRHFYSLGHFIFRSNQSLRPWSETKQPV